MCGNAYVAERGVERDMSCFAASYCAGVGGGSLPLTVQYTVPLTVRMHFFFLRFVHAANGSYDVITQNNTW